MCEARYTYLSITYMGNQKRQVEKLTTANIGVMLSSPVYAYGINLVLAERVAKAVMELNA